jgi:hypothetical protein
MSIIKVINLQHPTASTANITLSNTGGIALNGSVSGGGMDLITPTSVVGGTFSGGAISLNAITSASINGCFNALYDNYIITITCTATTVSAYVGMKFRNAGVDTSTGYNGASRYVSVSSGSDIAVNWGLAAASSQLLMSQPAPDSTFISLNVFSPYLTAKTGAVAQMVNFNGEPWRGGFSQTSITQFDGITFFVTSGTLSGTVRVYGLRNS